MLAIAQSKLVGDAVTWVQADAFAMPLASPAFDAVVAMRLAFHFADLLPLLASIVNVIKPGGTLVLDTYNWTPRSLVPLGRQTWGGRVYTHRPSRVISEAKTLGLEVIKRIECFLFSPYVYRLLPLQIVRVLERLESLTPNHLLARVFWHLRLSNRESLVASEAQKG